MSKRELSHNEEEKIPGSNPTKKVKGSQNQELISNGNLSPPKNRQNQSSNIFRINSVATKPSQEVEDDLETLIDREKQARITEIVLDSDSDASYYRYFKYFFSLLMIFLVKMKKRKFPILRTKRLTSRKCLMCYFI